MNFPENFAFILFGATGDLACKKLLPALYQAVRFTPALKKGRFICLTHHPLSRKDYFEIIKAHILQENRGDFTEEDWLGFIAQIDVLELDILEDSHFDRLAGFIDSLSATTKIFYLSTSPRFFSDIVRHLTRVGLHRGDARLVLEKPLGRDLASAQALHHIISQSFSEQQIYRIDHYLGKESVQNLMALRFGNRFLEPLWNRVHIRSVQITLAEDIGIDGRGDFYDDIGALRDMVQNHLLQLLCFVAMEVPYNLSPDAIRDEKLKILRSLRLYNPQEAWDNSIFGQYLAGMVAGQNVPRYTQEKNIPPQSITETFVALKMQIDNWRWAGVPFYLRTGKRLHKKLAQIVVSFRSVPHHLFYPPLGNITTNKLVINLQPEESMMLYMAAKPPGESRQLQSVALNLNFTEQLHQRRPSAYEKLLCDIIRGDLSLFVRQDELEEAWRRMTPFLDIKNTPEILKPYMAGSWGPMPASQLLYKEQTCWHEEEQHAKI